jgi:hypothetical protein
MEAPCWGIVRRHAAAQALEDRESRISTEKYKTTCKLEAPQSSRALELSLGQWPVQ